MKHISFPDQVFTIQEKVGDEYLTLYGINDKVKFNKRGKCVEAPLRSRFKVGQILEFYKSDSEY